MITIRCTRDNGMLTEFAPMRRSVEAALLDLLKYELGYGGQVVDFTATSITVRTHCMAALDVVRFEGPESDIAPLRVAASIFGAVRGPVQEVAFQPRFEMLSAGRGGIRAFDAVHVMPLLLGNLSWRVAAAVVTGIDPSEVKRVCSLSDEDFVAAMELARAEGCGLYDIVTATTPDTEAPRA